MKQEGKFRYENIIYLLLLLQCCLFFTYSHKYTIQYKIFHRNTFCGLLRFAGFSSSTKYKNENQMNCKGTSISCLFVCLLINIRVCIKFLHFPLVEAILDPTSIFVQLRSH